MICKSKYKWDILKHGNPLHSHNGQWHGSPVRRRCNSAECGVPSFSLSLLWRLLDLTAPGAKTAHSRARQGSLSSRARSCWRPWHQLRARETRRNANAPRRSNKNPRGRPSKAELVGRTPLTGLSRAWGNGSTCSRRFQAESRPQSLRGGRCDLTDLQASDTKVDHFEALG